MHCPGCGQQQVSNETKFCSRCGLPLGVVSEVLAHGGFLPQLAQLNKKRSVLNKKNGVVLSLFWFLFFIFLVAFFAILGAPEEFVGILAVTAFFGGFMIMLASLIFLRSSKEVMPGQYMPQPQAMYGMHGQQQPYALPQQQSVPANVYAAPQTGSWRDTNDLQPTSVTEGTTRLLEKDDL